MIKQKPIAILVTVPQQTYFDRNTLDMSPRIGIVSLVKWAKKFGYDVKFYDIDMFLPSNEEIFNYFKTNQPDIIGISAVVSTSYKQVNELSFLMKKACPSCLIVLGGHMAAAANVILRKTKVDICVLGDGEKGFVDLIEYVEKNGTGLDTETLLKIKGLAFINEEDEMEFTGYGERIPNSDLPFPDYDILSSGVPKGYNVLKNYIVNASDVFLLQHDPKVYDEDKQPKCAKIWVTKGCVGRCTFCQRFTQGFQIYDLNKVDEYLKKLVEEYNVHHILILGENFIADKKFAIEVAKIMKKHNIVWVCQGVRPDMVSFDDLKFFSECGCISVKYGVESGSSKMLKIMEKGYTSEDVFNTMKNSEKLNLFCPFGMCIGMPGETDQSIIETARLIARIAIMRGIPPTNLSVGNAYALPLPGAPLYEYGQLQGIIGQTLDEEEEYLDCISDKHNGKDGFINLSGQSLRKALFLEYLMYYESLKLYYYEKRKENKLKKREKVHSLITRAEENRKDTKKVNALAEKIKVFNMKKLLYLALVRPISSLNSVLCRTRISIYIPRILLYPIMRNLLYLEYIIQNLPVHIKGIFGNKDSFIYKYQYKKLKYNLDFGEGESLRKINEILRKKYPKPKTLTEKNQQILYLGR